MAKICVTLQRTYTTTIEIDGINDDLVESALRSVKGSSPEVLLHGRGELVWSEPTYRVKEAVQC